MQITDSRTGNKLRLHYLPDLSADVILDCFNSSFENYFVPLHFSREQFLHKLRSERVRLDLSVGISEGNRLVGFILHGIDQFGGELTAYNAGTGILPEYRGAGLTMKMYQHALDLLRQHNVDRTILEVICENDRAYRVYQKAGFSITRRLESFRSTVMEKPQRDVAISELPVIDFDVIGMRIPWSPTWQYSWGTINRSLADYKLWVTGDRSAPTAYCIADTCKGRIAYFNCRHADEHANDLRALFYFIAEKSPNGRLSVIHIDDRETACIDLLKSVGFAGFLSSWEMELRL